MAYTTCNVNVARNVRDKAGSGSGNGAAARPGRGVRLGVDFENFAESLRRSIVPASPLERVLADRLILAAWRLQLASAFEFDAALAGDDLPPISSETLDAEHSLDRSLEMLEASRADRLGRDRREASASYEYDEFEALAECDDDDDRDSIEIEDEAAETPRWQDRLIFDFAVSETSPVVKGTWVTASHVVSLVVDGYTWGDILRTHPELTEADIRSCLAYTVEQDGDEF